MSSLPNVEKNKKWPMIMWADAWNLSRSHLWGVWSSGYHHQPGILVRFWGCWDPWSLLCTLLSVSPGFIWRFILYFTATHCCFSLAQGPSPSSIKTFLSGIDQLVTYSALWSYLWDILFLYMFWLSLKLWDITWIHKNAFNTCLWFNK